MIGPHLSVALAALASSFVLVGPSQSRRAEPPVRPSAAADDTTLFAYNVDSVRVVQRVVPTTDVVAVNIYLLGGARQLTPATQGIEAMWLTASKFGTRNHPDSTQRAAWALTGSFFTSDLTSDWTMFGFRGVRDEFDASWDLITERIAQPTFPSAGVTSTRERLQASLKLQRESPDGEISSIADSVAFAGHPYGLSLYGSEESLAAIDSATLAGYVRAQAVRSRLLVVVVGNATRAMVEAAVRRTLAGLPVGTYRWTPPTPAPSRAGTVTLLQRRSATNYVIGVFNGPAETHDDFPSFSMATAMLGSMITEAVRERRGLSYAASASVTDRALVTGTLYVSTPKPDTVVRLIQAQIRTITNPDSMPAGVGFTSDKNSLQFLFRRSTSAVQADALAHAEILQGDYRLAVNVPRRLRSVTSSSVRQAAVAYMKNIQFIYAGDTTLVKRNTFVAKNR